MAKAWLANLSAYENSQKTSRTNAHRLLLFYAVECGLKTILMKRKGHKRSDSCTEIAECQTLTHKEEYPSFKTWVEEILPKYPASERKIPFAVEQFEMDQPTVRILEEMGVIYEDKEKDNEARFYMPEIFREGLGFSGKGARPRIVVLKRKVLGKGIL